MPDKLGPLSLSKREHFAALILAGMCANPNIRTDIPANEIAIAQADSLIEMLNGGPKSSDPEDVASEARWQEDKALDDFFHKEFYRPSGEVS